MAKRAIAGPQCQGFSLIEVVIVILIIAVLAALIVPSIANARERSNQLLALSNLKQISTSLFNYQESWKSSPRAIPAEAYTNAEIGRSFELLSADQDLPYQIFNNLGSERMVLRAPRSLGELYQSGADAGWGGSVAGHPSYGIDWSAGSNPIAGRAILAEHPDSWNASSVAIAFGDHSISRQDHSDSSQPPHQPVVLNPKFLDDNIFKDALPAQASGNFSVFMGGPRQQAYIRFSQP